MNRAGRTAIAGFGTIAGLAGLEHGIGEVLQGSVRPEGAVILSWPDAPFFAMLNGEPAMTLVPNLLVTGILAILVSLAFIGWVMGFVGRPFGGLVLVGISVVLLLVGGGFGPPLLGIILGIAASRIRSPHPWAARAPRVRHALSVAWPWILGGGLAAWLLVMPGVPLLAHVFGIRSDALVFAAILSAFSLLALSILAAFARDAQPLGPHSS